MKIFFKKKQIVENYTSNIESKRIDELEEMIDSLNDNINKEVNIPSDVLNSFRINDTLNQEIWDGDKLIQEIKNKLTKIATDFYNELNLPEEVKLKDIIFTGSLANYNWSSFSDVDLHVVLDFSKLEGVETFKEDFFYSQKALWNQNHDITIKSFPVEIYAQDVSAKLVATAVYSIKFDKWVLKPEREKFKINKKVIKQKAEKFIDHLKNIRTDYETKDFKSVIDKVTLIKDKIKNYRTAGLNNDGEFSTENIVFKVLRRTPFLDILDSYKAKAYDTMMSVEEVKTINEQVIIEEGDLVDNTTFKLSRDNGSEYTIEATYENEIIGKVHMDVIYDVENYFDGDFDEQQINQLFEEPLFIIEWLEVPDDYYKGAGVGRALMNKAIEFAKKHNHSQIYLNASPIGNDGLPLNELVQWYTTFGFKTILNQGNNIQMLLNFNPLNERQEILNMLGLITEANNKQSTKRDYYTTLFKTTKVKQLYGGDEYWENVQDGQWVGAVIVNIFGQISKISTYNASAANVRTNDLGMRGENPYYLEFKIMAGRGIEHPNEITPRTSSAKTRDGIGSEENPHQYSMQLPDGVSLENGETVIKYGLPIPGSPASDAHIKTYLIYGDVILDFVEKNLKNRIGYMDGKGEDISNQAMAKNPALEKKKIKKDLEMELGRRISDGDFQEYLKSGKKPQPKQISTIDTTKADEFQQRQADALARREKARNRNK